MARWVLTIEAQDRPGIVASVTSALAQAGCNLADVSMTRLSDVFVMLAVVIVPDGLHPEEMWSASLAESFSGEVSWRALTEQQQSPQETDGSRWNVTVYGSDQPGIVAAVTAALAKNDVNIDDLSTRLVGSGTGATYTMLIDATVPTSVDSDALRTVLSGIGEQMGVTCHATPVDVDTL